MTTLSEDIDLARQVVELRAANERLQRSNARLKAKEVDLVDAVYQAAYDSAVTVGKSGPIPRPARDRRRSPEVALLWLSDWQLGKRTSSYDSEIAQQRVKRAVQRAIKITEVQRQDHPVRDCHLVFGGDLLENLNIFPGQSWEVDSSTYAQMFTCSRLCEEVVMGLLAAFEHVHVYECWGNHGRIGRRGDWPKEDNIDRMICRIARDRLEAQARMTWHVPEGDPPDWHTIAQIGNYRPLFFHGDQIRTFGSTPVHAITKRVTDWASGVYEPFDDAYMGHFHRKMTVPLANGNSVYITPSTESGSAFARDHLGSDGIPRQRLHFIHPEKGEVTAEYMLYVG